MVIDWFRSFTSELITAFIVFLLSLLFVTLRKNFKNRNVKWFWYPANIDVIIIYCGNLQDAVYELGEIKPSLSIYAAQVLGEIKVLLSKYYRDVRVIFDRSAIDYRFPIISLGGPISNDLTSDILNSGALPYGFIGMPYSDSSDRAIGTGIETYKSTFNSNGDITSDVGFIARIPSNENPKGFLYIIAGNYGFGSMGVSSYLTSTDNLNELHKIAKKNIYFQAIINSKIANKNISSTQLIKYTSV